ncbi:MAG: EamA family transporter [Rhizobiales bacterium]|nr:EamA family transporter [Hyphomicrobiales bacterium]
MRFPHILLALMLTALWGANFIGIKLGGQAAPPLFLVTMRYVFTALPLVFFLPRPRAPWRTLILYGVAMGAIQFALLFIAIRNGMPAGLASLVMQSQVIFTMALAAVFLGERPSPVQIAGAAVALAGLGVIGAGRMEGAAALIPFLMCLAGAFSWSVGNILNAGAGKVDPLAFTAWTALSPIPILFVLSLFFEGPQAMAAALAQPSPVALAALAYMVVGSTLIGNSAWSYLLTIYPAGVVAPFSLLVPVFGMAAGVFALGERISAQEAWGGALVAAGLALNVLGPRLAARLARR